MRGSDLTFEQWIDERWWPKIGPTLAPDWRRSLESYFLRAIKRELGHHRLRRLTAEIIEEWWAGIRAHYKGSTANRFLWGLRASLEAAVRWGVLKGNPAQGLRRAKEPPGRVRWLTPEQRKLLLTEAHPRIRKYIKAALYTGARRRSLLELRWRDVDFGGGVLTFNHTKNGEPHVIPLHPKLREFLESLPNPQDPEAFVLPRLRPATISAAFRRLARRIGLRDFRFHDLRHEVASALSRSGASQRVIMEVLGHHDPRMSARYSHLTREIVQSAMERAL